MPPPVQAGLQGKGRITSSLRFPYLAESVALVVLALILAVAGPSYGQLSSLAHVSLAGLFLVALLVASRRAWEKLFGPVLFYDLLRVSRRSRYILIRFAYAAALAILVYWQFSQWSARTFGATRGPVLAKDMAVFAEQIFYIFMVVQLALVLCLTPAYAATSIAEEKERKTFEYLLTTDLRNREIVLSKLLSRLANLTLIVLTGLPILGFLQFLGGVDPDLVLAGFAATAITMVSLGSFSVLVSIYARKPRDGILFAFLGVAAYVALGFLALQVLNFPLLATQPLTPGSNPLVLGDLVNAFNAGNLIIVLRQLHVAWSGGKPLAGLIGGLLRNYLLWHGVAALACVLWAVFAVRRVSLRDVPRKEAPGQRRLLAKIGLRPMIWKEIVVEPGFRLRWYSRLVLYLFVVVSLIPPAWAFALYLLDLGAMPYQMPAGMVPIKVGTTLYELGKSLNGWARAMSTILGCLMLVGVAVRASTSVSGERDRETLDSLLTTPLQSHDILFGKWLGSLLSVRWISAWLGLIWIIALLTRAMHPLVVPLFLVAWLVYASFLAGVGIWFSTACRTSLRATFYTLAVCALLGGGHYLLYSCFIPVGPIRGLFGDFMGILSAFAPPRVLYGLTAAEYEFFQEGWGLWTILAYFALFFWALGALFIWTITRSRFRRMTSRISSRRPPQRAASASGGWGYVEESDSWQELGTSLRR